MRLLYLILVSTSLYSQVVIKITPESSQVQLSQLSNSRGLQRMLLEGCNIGSSYVTITSQQISIAASTISFVSNSDATLTLQNQAASSTPVKVAKALSISSEVAAIVVSLLSKANVKTGLWLSLGGSGLSQGSTILQNQAPSVAPLLTFSAYPLTLPPSGCFTDYRFASYTRSKVQQPPVVVTITVPQAASGSLIQLTPQPVK